MSRFKPGSGSSVVTTRPPMPKREMPRRAFEPEPVAKESVVEESEKQDGLTLPLFLTLLFIFFRFSFLHEVIMLKLGFDSHMLLILGGAAVLAAFLSGRLFEGMSHKIALSWFGFAACMCLATAASIWRGGSFAVLFPFLRTTLILVVMIPAVACSTGALSRVLKTIGIAGLVTVLLGLTVDSYRSGRLELSGAASISNSNDYAALLILVMPAIAYLTLSRGSSIVLKIIGLGSLALGCFFVLGTGSRGALVSMLLSALYLVKIGSFKIRIAILVGFPVVILMVIPFLPAESYARLLSLFNSKTQTEESAASQMQRTALLTESLKFTAEHPLLGVGPGTFSVYQARVAESQGERGMWHETHNSYTQVSSECGIPALFFYLSALFLTFRVFRQGRKSEQPDIRALSTVLGLMLVSFCVCMFFLSQAYGFGFPVLGGIAISLHRLLKSEEAAA